jgi:hypothetical protein
MCQEYKSDIILCPDVDHKQVRQFRKESQHCDRSYSPMRMGTATQEKQILSKKIRKAM